MEFHTLTHEINRRSSLFCFGEQLVVTRFRKLLHLNLLSQTNSLGGVMIPPLLEPSELRGATHGITNEICSFLGSQEAGRGGGGGGVGGGVLSDGGGERR